MIAPRELLPPTPPRAPERRPGRCLHAAAEGSGILTATVPRGLPADLIHDDEVVILALRPSILFVPLSALGSLVVILFITFALAYMSRLSWVGWTDTSAFALGVGLTALRLGAQALDWAGRFYILTDRRVLARRGVLRVTVFETPLRQIQHTSLFFLARERIFGLGTIGFATAGSDRFEAFWTMIADPVAVHRKIGEAVRRYRS